MDEKGKFVCPNSSQTTRLFQPWEKNLAPATELGSFADSEDDSDPTMDILAGVLGGRKAFRQGKFLDLAAKAAELSNFSNPSTTTKSSAAVTDIRQAEATLRALWQDLGTFPDTAWPDFKGLLARRVLALVPVEWTADWAEKPVQKKE